MVTRNRWLVGCVAALLLPAAASARPIQNARTESNIDWTSAAIGGVGGGSGTIQLSGVSGTVRRAFLYWHGIDRSGTGAVYDNEQVSINGTPVTGVSLGDATTNCWGAGSSRAFRADVTGQVAGNGAYAITGLSAQAGHSGNGASLVVVFDDGNPANNRDLVFFEGNDPNNTENVPGEDNGWHAVLSGINYQGGQVRAQLHMCDGQTFVDNSLTFSSGAGSVVVSDTTSLWDGTSVPSAGTSRATNGSLWDVHTVDLAGAFGVPGPYTLNMDGQLYVEDCLGLVLLLMDLEAGSAPAVGLCPFISGAQASHIELNIAALPVPLTFPLVGSAKITCGEVGEDDTAPCSCDIVNIDSINIPSIGYVCLAPLEDPCPPQQVDCDGGSPLGIELRSDGDIAACDGNVACDTLCDAYCADRGTARVDSGCTGYCSAGTMQACTWDDDCLPKCSDTKVCSVTTATTCTVDANCPATETCVPKNCATDADCPVGNCLPSNGSCNGPDPVGANGNLCQCQCVNSAAGDPGRPGELQCNLGASLNVEDGPPCGDGDVKIAVGSRCIPLTTATASSLISRSNFSSHCILDLGTICTANAQCGAGNVCSGPTGAKTCTRDQGPCFSEACSPEAICTAGNTLPPSGPASNTGQPAECSALLNGLPSGAKIRGVVNFFGSSLGDLVTELFVDCESGAPLPTTATPTWTASPTITVVHTPTPTPVPTPLCLAAPRTGCRTPGKSLLLLKDDTDDAKDHFVWKWLNGTATDLFALGNPVAGSTDYALCIYGTTAGSPQLVMNTQADGGTMCAGTFCWQPTGVNGFRYRDRDAMVDGLTAIRIATGTEGEAKIIAKGKGMNLPMPIPADPNNLLRQDTTVVVQLVNTEGQCWEATYSAPATKVTGALFKDKF